MYLQHVMKVSFFHLFAKNRSDCSRNENRKCFVLFFINSGNIRVLKTEGFK
jgi:hypothetical protein